MSRHAMISQAKSCRVTSRHSVSLHVTYNTYHNLIQYSNVVTVRHSPGQESSVDPKGDPGSHSTVPCIPSQEMT